MSWMKSSSRFSCALKIKIYTFADDIMRFMPKRIAVFLLISVLLCLTVVVIYNLPPVNERLFFAGEAVSLRDFSTAHGAFATGVDAAEAAIAAQL